MADLCHNPQRFSTRSREARPRVSRGGPLVTTVFSLGRMSGWKPDLHRQRMTSVEAPPSRSVSAAPHVTRWRVHHNPRIAPGDIPEAGIEADLVVPHLHPCASATD